MVHGSALGVRRYALGFRNGTTAGNPAAVVGVDVGCRPLRQLVVLRDRDVVSDLTANSRDNTLRAPGQEPQEHERQREPGEPFHLSPASAD